MQGLLIFLLPKPLKLKGIDVKYKYFPWKRAYETTAKGVSAIGTLLWFKNSEREKVFYFSDPVLVDKEVFFHLKGLNFKWKNFSDLRKYKVGASRGYAHVTILQNAKVKIDIANNDETNFKKLLRGRIDIFPCSLLTGYYIINKNYNRAKAALFTNDSKALDQGDMFVMFSRKNPESKKILKIFNKGLKIIKKNGVYDNIMNKVH